MNTAPECDRWDCEAPAELKLSVWTGIFRGHTAHLCDGHARDTGRYLLGREDFGLEPVQVVAAA